MNHGNDAVVRFLDWCDLALRRVITGLFYFLGVTFPDWVQNAFRCSVELAQVLLRETWPTLVRGGNYLARVSFKAARVSAFAVAWLLLALFPLGLSSMGSGLLMWLAVAWLLVILFASASGYLRWRAIEDRARDEWRDVVVKGRSVQEWAMEVVAEGVTPDVRQLAVKTLVDSETVGQMALMAILVIDEGEEIHVTSKMWSLAVLGEMGSRGLRFEMAVRNLYLVSQNQRIKQAALSALSRIGACTPGGSDGSR